ncbi:MAG: glucosamine-6-phosphate deaminase [Verrucomicrobia bacterium]|nr:glucosamine-6-phosphate deaminase [Verrucomicrobiota bacterium]
METQFQTRKFDSLDVRIYRSQEAMAEDVASEVGAYLRDCIRSQGSAAAIMATGNSQIRFLSRLVEKGEVDWSHVTLFHMDEYLGIDAGHKASFRRYMRERVESLARPRAFHYIEGDAALPLEECERYEALLRAQTIDLCCLGIGENGHLAFNDPPVARFEDRRWVKIVKLDDACKGQQVREGHFPSLESVPPYAITLTVPALCQARRMFCVAPEKRKAVAVRDTLCGPVSTACPASYLRTQAQASLYLDHESAGLIG